MRLILETDKQDFLTSETITIRLLALNDSYEPVAVDRRLLVGPNPVPERPVEPPLPVSLKPAFPEEEQNCVMLNPWCFYGRQRTFDGFLPGQVTISAYLLRQPIGSLLPQGPGEPEALLASAEPLVLTILPR